MAFAREDTTREDRLLNIVVDTVNELAVIPLVKANQLL